MVGNAELALARARGERWLVANRASSLDDAARFIADVGFALLFPTDRPVAPSLWEAIAGPDTVPFEHGMGEPESTAWTWKDALPEAGLAWSGRLVHRRASFLSPRLLTALYNGDGEPDDAREFALSPESHRIADALLTGPLPSSALRELVGNRSRYDRAISELQRHLLVTSAGVMEQRTGWPAVLLDLTCRRFDVGGRANRQDAAAQFLDTMIEATPAELSRAYGWPTAVARTQLDASVEAGRAVQSPSGYRPNGHA